VLDHAVSVSGPTRLSLASGGTEELQHVMMSPRMQRVWSTHGNHCRHGEFDTGAQPLISATGGVCGCRAFQRHGVHNGSCYCSARAWRMTSGATCCSRHRSRSTRVSSARLNHTFCSTIRLDRQGRRLYVKCSTQHFCHPRSGTAESLAQTLPESRGICALSNLFVFRNKNLTITIAGPISSIMHGSSGSGNWPLRS
jgi:hypothetical protein